MNRILFLDRFPPKYEQSFNTSLSFHPNNHSPSHVHAHAGAPLGSMRATHPTLHSACSWMLRVGPTGPIHLACSMATGMPILEGAFFSCSPTPCS